MKKRLIFTLLPILLLMSCTGTTNPSDPVVNPPSNPSGPTAPDGDGNTEGGNTEGNTTEENTTGENTGSNTGSGDNTGTSTEEDDGEFVRQKLDCGYTQMDLPNNHNNPVVIETSYDKDLHWWNNEMYDEMPSNFRGIYGNNEWTSVKKFYSYDENNPKSYPGGLKFDQASKGFQTSEFTVSGNKLEIRIGISQVNDAGGKPEDSVPTAYLYYFNKNGEVLVKYTVEQETITTKSAGNYLKTYVTASYVKDIAYMEFRLMALAFKGSQNYNIGISYFNICSWAYGAN